MSSQHYLSHRSSRRAASGPFALRFAVLAAALALAIPAHAVDLRFATENDFFTSDNRDDLYTFSVALSADRGPYTVSFRENAFTDREAGIRFDESRLTVRRAISGAGAWDLQAEVGKVHVGHGIFGQEAQNLLHGVLGDDQLDLRYLESDRYASLGVEAERTFAFGPGLDLGPRLEIESVPGFRSHAAVGAQGRWEAGDRVTVHFFAGGRWSDASPAVLDRHLAPLAPIARLGVVFGDGLVVSWTYNDYGDEREHLSVGFVVDAADTLWPREPWER